MRINICGDFTTMGEGMKSVLQGTALSTEIVKLFQESDLNIVNFESPVVADKNAAIVKSFQRLHLQWNTSADATLTL